MPVVVGNAIGTVLSGSVITRTKKYKNLTGAGNIAGFIGFLLILWRWQGSTRWMDAILVCLPGAGMGIIQSTTFVHLAASLDHGKVPIAASTWFLAQSVGVLLGASCSTALINRVLVMRLEELLKFVEDRDDVRRSVYLAYWVLANRTLGYPACLVQYWLHRETSGCHIVFGISGIHKCIVLVQRLVYHC